ncbi:MAG: hypothetical protein B7X93_07380 [Hydrogenophilales bacterium 17-61-9]|nr:MAG: hypothetical protein B7X93_07380 [Hydrogenophilales bacterium 17-61-9]
MNFEGYEREGRVKYAEFAATVALILEAAIGLESGYRLQQVKERAKQPTSLRKKLEQRGIAGTEALEDEIKDLAGCRVIFYTNSDVTRFINSGIIYENFEVLEVKLHQPKREVEDAAELYISNHYIVRIRPERIVLPEYARFSGVRCEIQIQTILNHAWAEMAHDTIYKAPTLDEFGGREFDGIKRRMQKVAQKYLLPAGYEFQKIASDFQRLIEGKALFDGDALEAIVDAADNNIRVETIETFAENVLPFYDDLQAVYPEIVERLVVAADRAHATPPVAIETPYGTLPPQTLGNILDAIARILTRYRYIDVGATFDATRRLYRMAENEDERKPLLELGKALAGHQLDAWQKVGPTIQAMLVERIEALDENGCRELAPLLNGMLSKVLGTEIQGMTSSSSAVTFHRGAVEASEPLRVVREKAIALLKRQFTLAGSDEERGMVLLALNAATQTPTTVAYSNELARLVMVDTSTVLEFQREIAPKLSLELLQRTEHRVHRCYWKYADLPEKMREEGCLVASAGVKAAAIAFRDVANANADFVIYKALVGFESVFPPAWDNDAFDYNQAGEYRAKQIDAFLASVEDADAEPWFDRISRYALTESADAATFPVFGNFLEQLAETKPTIVLGYVDQLDGPLENFLPVMLAGLMRSDKQAETLERVDGWLRSGTHIRQLAWYLRFADPFDEELLRRALDSAIQLGDEHGVRNALTAASSQFAGHPGTLVEAIFLPAIRFLAAAKNLSWVRMPWFSWRGNPIIRALNEDQASIVLNALVPYPELEYDAEDIAAVIAERWPAKVVAYLGERQAFARTDAAPSRYDAVPFTVDDLRPPLAAAPDILLHEARIWFDAESWRFKFDGGRLLASVFPDLSNGLEMRLAALIAGGNDQDLAFVLGVLSAFEGKPCIYEHLRAVVTRLGADSPLLDEVRSALHESGVVSGEFGFANLYTRRKELLEPWLADPSEKVRIFANEEIRDLDRQIAAENRSADASIALRKLDYGEELGAVEERR